MNIVNALKIRTYVSSSQCQHTKSHGKLKKKIGCQKWQLKQTEGFLAVNRNKHLKCDFTCEEQEQHSDPHYQHSLTLSQIRTQPHTTDIDTRTQAATGEKKSPHVSFILLIFFDLEKLIMKIRDDTTTSNFILFFICFSISADQLFLINENPHLPNLSKSSASANTTLNFLNGGLIGNGHVEHSTDDTNGHAA